MSTPSNIYTEHWPWRGIYYSTLYEGLRQTEPVKAYWWFVRIPVLVAGWLQRRGIG